VNLSNVSTVKRNLFGRPSESLTALSSDSSKVPEGFAGALHYWHSKPPAVGHGAAIAAAIAAVAGPEMPRPFHLPLPLPPPPPLLPRPAEGRWPARQDAVLAAVAAADVGLLSLFVACSNPRILSLYT